MRATLIDLVFYCINILLGAYAIKKTIVYFQQKEYFAFALWLIGAILNIQAILS